MRRIAEPTETVIDLATLAGQDCIGRAGVDRSRIGLVLVSSGSSERRFPGPASSVAARLGLAGVPAIDLPIASAGAVFGLGGYIGNIGWPQMANGAVWLPVVFLFLLRAGRVCCAQQLDTPISYADPAAEISDGHWIATTMRESATDAISTNNGFATLRSTIYKNSNSPVIFTRSTPSNQVR